MIQFYTAVFCFNKPRLGKHSFLREFSKDCSIRFKGIILLVSLRIGTQVPRMVLNARFQS